MMDKLKVNIIYSNGGDLHPLYENNEGIVFMSQMRQANMHNVAMGYHSMRDRTNEDYFLLVEPFCVTPEDYDPEFLRGFKRVFSWASRAMPEGITFTEINHPSFYQLPTEIGGDWNDWNHRANEIAFIANNKRSDHHSETYSLRVQLADMLHNKSNFRVAWYGENPGNKPYFKGRVDSKHNLLKTIKFCVCSENCFDPTYSYNYLTEKMPDVWMAGAVPIYMGCSNIDDFGFFEHSYIDLRIYVQGKSGSFTIDEASLIKRIEHYSNEQYLNYCNNVKQNLFKEGRVKAHVGFEPAFDTIIKTLSTA